MGFLIAVDKTLSEAWNESQGIARSLKDMAQAQKVGSLGSSQIMNFEGYLRSFLARLGVIASKPGIAAFVTGLADTPAGYDVVATYNTMATEITNTINWIHANLPKDANGFLLLQTIGPDGLIDRTFDATALATYRTQLDKLTATIV